MKWLAAISLALLSLGCSNDPRDRVVGVWSGQMQESALPPIPIPGFEKDLQRIMNSMVLKLRSDKTFVFLAGPGPGVSGTWSLQGTTLDLKPETGKLPQQFGGMAKDLSGTFEDGYSKLNLEQPTPFGPVKIGFKKTA